MQEGNNAPELDHKEQLNGMGWYRWGCKCCGPKSGAARRLANRWLRRKRKLQTARMLSQE